MEIGIWANGKGNWEREMENGGCCRAAGAAATDERMRDTEKEYKKWTENIDCFYLQYKKFSIPFARRAF